MTSNRDASHQPDLPCTNSRYSRFTVDVSLANSNIWMHSYFLTGLVQLAKEGMITLRTMSGRDLSRCLSMQRGGYSLLTLKCTEATRNNSRFICFDTEDHSDVWQTKALEECDVYFKRSTYLPDIERLAKSQQFKIRPINPMFATWSSGAGGWNLRLPGAFFMEGVRRIAAHQSPKEAVSYVKGSLRVFAFLSTLDNYEDAPASAKERRVLFQTRIWDPSQEEGDWVEECNRHRVEMVRILRRRLGDRCVGGLVRSPYTEKKYPDLLSNLTPTAKSKRSEFIHLCRQFLVRVNIKALFEATPYSLGETLAANNCLVSEYIRNSFATPLVEGKHYVGFTTPEDCADRCQELLDSDDKAIHLREEAHAYYRKAVRPKEAIWSFLEQAMS